MSKGKILIMGATGVAGTWLTRRAIESGYDVRAMVRSTSNRDGFEGLDVEFFEVVLIEGFAWLRGAKQAPLLTRARIKFLALNLDFSIAKTREKLGYDPQTNFRDGMKSALDWAASQGWIEPASERKAG